MLAAAYGCQLQHSGINDAGPITRVDAFIQPILRDGALPPTLPTWSTPRHGNYSAGYVGFEEQPQVLAVRRAGVDMHVHQAGNNEFGATVDDFGAFRHERRGRWADMGKSIILDHDSRVRQRWSAQAVNQRRAGDRDGPGATLSYHVDTRFHALVPSLDRLCQHLPHEDALEAIFGSAVNLDETETRVEGEIFCHQLVGVQLHRIQSQ